MQIMQIMLERMFFVLIHCKFVGLKTTKFIHHLENTDINGGFYSHADMPIVGWFTSWKIQKQEWMIWGISGQLQISPPEKSHSCGGPTI